MDCIFCKIAAGEIPSELVYHDEEMVAFRDINPAAPAHFLIVPREHIERIDRIGEQHVALIGRMHLVAAKIAADMQLGDFRLVINCGPEAGQSVFHIHMHLLGGRTLEWPPG